MARMFGTDGVRGVANTELTAELAMKLGKASAYVLTKNSGKERAKIVIGKDTRISSDMLENAFAAGVCSFGADVHILGVVPTPAVAFLVKQYGADAGVMISASHNPVEFNGIKLFNKDGFKLKDQIEDEIENIVLNGIPEEKPITGINLGRVIYEDRAASDYIKHIIESVDSKAEKIKVVLDLANGSASATAERLFKALGAEIHIISGAPDGTNINDDCGSTHLENIKKAVLDYKADLGLAFDGDADRCLAVDENGEEVDGDKIIAIFAWYMKENGILPEDTAVVTVMSNLGFFEFSDKYGINAISAKVGDRYVLEKMIDGGYRLGGEQSGHIILSEFATTGDGQLTGAFLLKIMKESKMKMSALAKLMEKYPQVIKNVVVQNEDKARLETDREIKEVISSVSEELKKCGRVLVRASGTEPLIRVMIEGKDLEVIEKSADKIVKIIEKRLK